MDRFSIAVAQYTYKTSIQFMKFSPNMTMSNTKYLVQKYCDQDYEIRIYTIPISY